MVLQGKRGEMFKWSVPSGQLESGEDFLKCCLREAREETGFDISVHRELFVKRGHSYGIEVEVHYFLAEVIGGSLCIQDPDGLIHEIGWKSAGEIMDIDLAFPEDRDFLLTLANGRVSN